MAISYDGLTRNAWTGTWSPNGDHPIALGNEIRGGIHFVSGNTGDQLTDIPGQRLQEGMLVYVQSSYGSFTGGRWYTYNLLTSESRSAITGAVPNADGNWTEFSAGGGSGATSLSGLTDVSTATPSDGQVLKWDAVNNEWAPSSDLSSSGGTGIALTDLSVSTDPVGTSALTYDNATGTFTYTPPDLSAYQLTANAFDGDYNSLTNTPTIPADVSDLTDTTNLLSGGSASLTPWSIDSNGHFIPDADITYDIGSANYRVRDIYMSGSTLYFDTDTLTRDNNGDLLWKGNDVRDYNQLKNKPDLSDLTSTSPTNPNRPVTYSTFETTLDDYVTETDFQTWVNNAGIFSGNYNDLTNKPTIPASIDDLTDVDTSTTAPTTGQALVWDGSNWVPGTVASSGGSGTGIALTDLSVTKASAFGTGNLTFNTSTGVFLFTPPDLSTYSTFSGNYSDLQGLPTLFSGNYNDLTNTPSNVLDLGIELSGATLQLVDEGNANSVIDSVDLSTISGYINYNQLLNKPTLFSGNYNDLTNIPAIPSLSGYATETYVQNYVSGLSSDNLTEGSTNLFFNDERVDDRVAALVSAGTGLSVSYDDAGNLLTISSTSASLNVAADGATTDTIDLSAGDTLTFSGDTGITTSVTGGTVSIDLDDTTVTPGSYGTNTQIPVLDIDQQGRITGATTTTISTDLPIAGDTGTDTISLLTDTLTISGGTGVTTNVASDTVTIEIGQPVGTTDDVTFNNVTVSGDLNVEGTLTAINTTNTTISDNIIVLNEGETGAGITSGSSGIEIDRGTEAAVRILYDETDDQWTFGTETVESGHLVPTSDATYDLGSPTKSWNNLYLGNVEITANANGFSVGGSTMGGEEETQSITTSNITATKRDIVMAGQTTDATPTEIFLLDGSSVIDIDNEVTAKFVATVVSTDGTDCTVFTISGLVMNKAGTTMLVGNNVVETLVHDSGYDWEVDITADDVGDYLKIVVTGEPATTIDWTVFVALSEVKR